MMHRLRTDLCLVMVDLMFILFNSVGIKDAQAASKVMSFRVCEGMSISGQHLNPASEWTVLTEMGRRETWRG